MLTLLALAACSAATEPPRRQSPSALPAVSTGTARVTTAPLSSSTPQEPATPASPPSQLDPDGNDEIPSGDLVIPERAHFEKVGRHWAALQRICDFAVLGEALYMAHATRPLGLTGATITRYQPDAKPPFSLGFDWNREGEPEPGGAGGQGFLRLRLIDGRLYAPDADPPYLGLETMKPFEGYVFASDAHGTFASVRMPGHRLPRVVTDERSGAFVIPGAIHVFDVIRFRGKIYTSTSAAIPPNGTAKSSPGTLLTPSAPGAPWEVAYTYAGAPGEASVRLGYMTRFRDRLYVAVSPIVGLDHHDYVVITPPRGRDTIEPGDATAVQATPSGAAHTLRWFTDRGRLYWISVDAEGGSLRVSDDGDHFRVIALPADAGAPSDMLRVGEHLLVLAERGLYELTDTGFALRARVAEQKTPFQVDDGYCSPPMIVFRGALYAGDQIRGALWRLVAD